MAKLTKQEQARDKEGKDVRRWQSRIKMSNRIFDRWRERFLCRTGWEWYEGYQGERAFESGDPSRDPYIINLIYPTVEVKIPSLYFHRPKVRITPRPTREDDPMTLLQERAKLREDMCNTFIHDPRLHFKDHTELSLKESFFYYGLVEIGYSVGDWIDNPNAQKPVLMKDGTEVKDSDGLTPVLQPDRIPKSEEIYVRRIPAEQFRVSARSEFILENCDWVGYYEWVYNEDLKQNPRYSNTDRLASGGKLNEDYDGKIPLTTSVYDSEDDEPQHRGMTKIWKLWDLRTRTRFVIPDDQSFYLLPPQPYVVFPFADLKVHERLTGWLPMPPHFNWMCPQAELNETRDSQRIHRKRMYRRYQMQRGSMTPEEKTKMEEGGDGVVVETNVPVPAVIPIDDAQLDSAVARNVPQSKEDLMNVAAVGGDQRGVAESETATQAQVIEARTQIREDFGKLKMANFLAKIATIIIKTAEAHMSLPAWIIRNTDPLGPAAMFEVARIQQVWQQITAQELGELSWDASVDIENLSPANEAVERQNWTQVLTILTNPMLVLLLRASDVMLRKTLGFYGVRSEKDLMEIRKAMEVMLLAMMAQQGGGGGGGQGGGGGEGGKKGGGKPGQKKVGQGASPGPTSQAAGQGPPDMTALMQQISRQVGLTRPN
jgi:hypothetical protein